MMCKKSVKSVFLFVIVSLMISSSSYAGRKIPNISADMADTVYLEQFNKLIGNNYSYNDYLTREDFCAAISKIFITGNPADKEIPCVDYEKINPENRRRLYVLYEKRILRGTWKNGQLYMNPKSIMTRQEAYTLLARTISKSSDSRLTFSDEALIKAYAYNSIAWFDENGFIEGSTSGSFEPAERITAGELAVLTIKTLDYVKAGSTNVETVFGLGSRGHIDGSGLNTRFTLPYGILCDNKGKIIVFDTYNNAIRTISFNKVETLTGGTSNLDDNGFSRGYYLDDTVDKALLNRPAGGAYNSQNELFFADSANNVIRFIKGNTVYTFSGTTAGYKDGTRDTAKFNNPMAIAIDKNDNIYVADTLNDCIRKIDKNGNVTTIAGTPTKEGYMDGSASSSLFRSPAGIAVNDDGSIIYVADTGNHMIRKIENGKVTTIAGTIGETDDGYPLGGFRNGAAKNALFKLPRGIIILDGVIVVADSGNNMIRAVTKSGNVVTLAGNGEPGDFDGSCLEAVLNNPSGIAFYEGSLFIADTGNNKVKKIKFYSNLYD